MEKSRTPTIFQGETISIAQVDTGLRAAIRACVLGEKPWPLFLWGSPGTGKTCAAMCLIGCTEKKGEFFTLRRLCEAMNDVAMGRFEYNGHALLGPKFRAFYLEQPSLVVLDEIGTRGNVSDAHYESVLTVLDCRRNKPFVAISNLEPKALEKVYDGRIVSRLLAGTPIEVKGKDRRI